MQCALFSLVDCEARASRFALQGYIHVCVCFELSINFYNFGGSNHITWGCVFCTKFQLLPVSNRRVVIRARIGGEERDGLVI